MPKRASSMLQAAAGAVLFALLTACGDMPTTTLQAPAAFAANVVPGAAPAGSFFRVGSDPAVYLSLGGDRAMLVPDWHTYLACSGGGPSLVRTLSAMPGSMVSVLPSAKQNRWMGSFRPIQRQSAPDGTTWLVSGCFRAPFPTQAAFVMAEGTIEDNAPWSRIEVVNASAYDALPSRSTPIEGYRPLPQRTLIRWAGDGEIRMVVGPGMALGIDSEATFNSHCFDWGEIQTVDQATFNAHPLTGVLHHGGSGCTADDRFPIADGFDYPVSPYAVATRAYTSSDGAPDRYYLAQGFRAYGSSGYHDGEDWNGDGGGNTDCGDAVYAPANGKIVNRQQSAAGWGNALVIEHRLPDGRRTQTIVAHHESLVRTHGVVRRGELIATVGTTGNSSACHLHWGHRNPGDPYWNQFGLGYSTATSFPNMGSASAFVDQTRVLTVP